MPKITDRNFFDGAMERVVRLGLEPLWRELEEILTGFEMLVEERRDANGAAEIRALLDGRFQRGKGWDRRAAGGVDWTKCHTINGARVCLGVEIQFSGRSDLLIVDVAHLRDEITTGRIDVGIIAVPSDRLAVFLTDRVARYADAVKAVERARAQDLPLAVLGLEHDGPGAALKKRQTRQGRAGT
jgi:restriction endonuclease BglII